MHSYFSFKEEDMHYTVSGKGSCVLLLHGFMEHSAMWKEMSKELCSRYKVICPDLPGHGESAVLGYVHTMEDMAIMVEALLKHLGVRRVNIVGHSMGGYVALAFARLFPEKVKSITLFHSTAAADSTERKQLRERAIKIVKQNKRHYINETIPNLFSPYFRNKYPALVNRSKEWAMECTPRAIVAAIEGMKRRKDSYDVLRSANFPFLFIAGKLDSGIPFSALKDQFKMVKSGKFTLLEGVAHMGFVEESEVTLNLIRKFINSV